MYNIIALLIKLFRKVEEEKNILDDRIEFRINSKEKELITKYCELISMDRSVFLRTLAIKEIDKFINNARP